MDLRQAGQFGGEVKEGVGCDRGAVQVAGMDAMHKGVAAVLPFTVDEAGGCGVLHLGKDSREQGGIKARDIHMGDWQGATWQAAGRLESHNVKPVSEACSLPAVACV